MSHRRERYYQSAAPPYDPHAQATDGLDAVLINGVEVGGKERARLRQAVERQRKREAAFAALSGED